MDSPRRSSRQSARHDRQIEHYFRTNPVELTTARLGIHLQVVLFHVLTLLTYRTIYLGCLRRRRRSKTKLHQLTSTLDDTATMTGTTPKPLLQEYTAFHGMLCRPKTARRVIQSFSGGVLLFAHQNVYDAAVAGNADLAHYDCRIAPIRLNVWTYYMLVAMSLTGGCSLLGYRRVISAIEYNTNNTTDERRLRYRRGEKSFFESSKASSMLPLRLPHEAVDYVIDQSMEIKGSTRSTLVQDGITEVTLIRKFEYDFGGFLSVMMLHFLCSNGRTHLVEIFRINTKTVLGFIANTMLNVLNGVNSFLIHMRPQRK